MICSRFAARNAHASHRTRLQNLRETGARPTRTCYTVAITTGAACFSFFSRTVAPMNKTVIEVHVRAVLPTSGGLRGFHWE